MTCDYELYQERIVALTARYGQISGQLDNTVTDARRAQLVEELELIDGCIARLQSKAQRCRDVPTPRELCDQPTGLRAP